MVGLSRNSRTATACALACAVMTVTVGEAGMIATVTGAERPWLFTLPLASDAPARTYDARQPVKIDAGPSTLVCVGADERATVCERFVGDGETQRHYVLDEGRRVQGRYLVGREGAAGASIRVRPTGVEARRPLVIPLARRAKEWVTVVTTDDAGWYEIEHLAPGSYIFEVTTRNGRVEESGVIEIPPLKKPVPNERPPSRTMVLPDVRFAEGVTVVVEVRSTDGMPIPAALVEVSQTAAGAVPDVFEGNSDAKGVATLEGIDAAIPGRVGCAATGFTRFSEAFDVLPALVTCTLARLATIKGSVVDARGEPVPRATVEVHGAHRNAMTDTSGAFAIEAVSPGTYTIRATSSRSGMGTREVTVSSGESLDLGELPLGETRDMRGRVVAAVSGQAIVGASVTAIDPPGASAVTDSDGAFSLLCDASARTRIRVAANGYAAVESAFDADATIRMPRPGSLDLLVWDDATGELCVGCTMVANSSNGVVSGITNGEGSVRFERLAPGDYQVTRERVTSTSRGITVSGGADTQTVSVRANETTHLEIGSRLRRFKVTIDPAPAAAFELRAHSSQRVITAVAEAPGQYSFRARSDQEYDLTLVTIRKGVFIGHVGADYAGQVLSFQLGNGEARLRIMKNEEEPAADVLVRLVNVSGAPAAWAITDAAGFASIPYMRAGTYSVLVEGQPIGTVVPGEVARTLNLPSR